MSAYRIKSPQDLKTLRANKMVGERVATRIERELEISQQRAKQLGLRTPGKPKKRETVGEQTFCQLPPVEPADRLYQALAKRWGRFYSGGEVVWELQPFQDSGYRLDAAYSGEREHSYRSNVNTFFLNALPTEVCTSGVHVQSIS